jgi:chlorite dismutase
MSGMQTYKKGISDEERKLFEDRRKSDEEKPRQFVNFAFYKLDPQFRREFNDNQRAQSVEELAQVLDDSRRRFLIYPYSTLGIRPEVDFLVWRISYRLEDFEEATAELLRTRIGKYLETPYSYLAMTGPTIYVDEINDEQHAESNRNVVVIGGGKYLFVYPFVKTRPWYTMSQEDRMNAMREHIRVGRLFPSVKLNTTYSFGLDDQDFVVAFESDYPQDFLDLVKQLRETEASTYTQRDTPVFTCMQQDVRVLLSHVCAVERKL